MRRFVLKLLVPVLLLGGTVIATDVQPAAAGHEGGQEKHYSIYVGAVHASSCFTTIPVYANWFDDSPSDFGIRHEGNAYVNKLGCSSAVGTKFCAYDDWVGYLCADHFVDFGQGTSSIAVVYGHCAYRYCTNDWEGQPAIGGINYLSSEFRVEYYAWGTANTHYCERWAHDPWAGWRWLGWWNQGDLACPWAFAFTSEPSTKIDAQSH